MEATNSPSLVPTLRVTLECSSFLSQRTSFEVTVTITHEAKAEARPVVFHTHIFKNPDNYQLYRLQDGKWAEWDDEDGGGCGGFLLVDEPDVAVDISQNERFQSLQPGESWVTSQLLHDKTGSVLPDDATDGEEFRYRFNGETVDWWDWGSKAEHAGTVVKLPCWLAGRVVEPKDNNGRPKLVVPTSQMIAFSVRGAFVDYSLLTVKREVD
jgi:hypothetical protein